MAQGRVDNVGIAGIASAVPEALKTVDDIAAVFGEDQARKLSKNTGVVRSHVAKEEICTSDLCFVAAEELLQRLEWDRRSVDVLVFVSVTPDYITPATACTLQHRLGLNKACASFDITHACSGYLYGLWVVAHLLGRGQVKRALLLVGDTSSRFASPYDRSVAALVGDGGSATALEWNESATPMHFEMGSDGSGAQSIMVRAGAFRHPSNAETKKRTEREAGNVRSDEDVFMNGPDIFAFALREVPRLHDRVLELAGWTLDDVQAVVMHQANRFIIQHLGKKLKIPDEKLVDNLAGFGNTSGATIPLALTTRLSERLTDHSERLVLLGFGTGLSWGGVALTCGPIVMPDLLTVSEDAIPH